MLKKKKEVPRGLTRSKERPLTFHATRKYFLNETTFKVISRKHTANNQGCCHHCVKEESGVGVRSRGSVLGCITGDTQTVTAADTMACPEEDGTPPSTTWVLHHKDFSVLEIPMVGESTRRVYNNPQQENHKVAPKILGRVYPS